MLGPKSKRKLNGTLPMSPEKATKRSRTDYDNDYTDSPSTSRTGFVNGAITKIELKDFMTHQSFEMDPISRVNIITGPNGAGKSTILLAISVGLGKKRDSISISNFGKTKLRIKGLFLFRID